MHRHKMRKLQARPPWVNGALEAAINILYARRDQIITTSGVVHAVDHFFPLRHREFSGLDVPWNLRVITAKQNGAKNNKRPDVFYSPREFRRITRQLDRCAARLRG